MRVISRSVACVSGIRRGPLPLMTARLDGFVKTHITRPLAAAQEGWRGGQVGTRTFLTSLLQRK